MIMWSRWDQGGGGARLAYYIDEGSWGAPRAVPGRFFCTRIRAFQCKFSAGPGARVVLLLYRWH